MHPSRPYWFPAKSYGWGWGLPTAWQGWAVLIAFMGLVILGVVLFPPQQSLAAFIACVAVLSLLLIGIGWLKGEPPRWRWGDNEPS